MYRALENSAKKKGVRFLLNYHMDAVVRDTPSSGRVLGIKASYTPKFLPGSTTPMKPFRSDGVIAMDAKTASSSGSSAPAGLRRCGPPRVPASVAIRAGSCCGTTVAGA